MLADMMAILRRTNPQAELQHLTHTDLVMLIGKELSLLLGKITVANDARRQAEKVHHPWSQ